jgi:hypothetical protein
MCGRLSDISSKCCNALFQSEYPKSIPLMATQAKGGPFAGPPGSSVALAIV